MKLSIKVYFPFLVLSFFILITSCDKEDKAISDDAHKVTSSVDTIKLAWSYHEKATLYDNDKNYDSAFYYYNAAKNLFAIKKDSLSTGYALIFMARIQYISGDYFGSEATATEAMVYVENSEETAYRKEVYNMLGMNYKKLLNYDEALLYYNKSLRMAKDTLSKCIIRNNKATVYMEQKKYDQSVKELKELLQSTVVLNDSATKARVLTSLGNTYLRMNKPQAVNYLEEGFKIRQHINSPTDLMSSYVALSEAYVSGNRPLAKKYAEKAYAIAGDIKNDSEKLRALEVLILSSSGSDFRNYTVEYIALQDNIDIVKMIAKNQFAKIKYDSKIVQEENIRLKGKEERARLTAEKERVKAQFLFTLSAFIIIVLVLLYFIMRLKYRKEKIKEVYKTENRIAKKVHDELANDVFRVMSFAETLDIESSDKKERLIQDLDHVYGRTRNISRENSSIETGENYPIVIKELLAEYNTGNVKVAIMGLDSINWNELNELKKIALFRILQELMVNMKKHSNASLIVVRFNRNGKKIDINYKDDGIGFETGSPAYKNGLINAESRIASIGGTITFNSIPGEGLKVHITFPA